MSLVHCFQNTVIPEDNEQLASVTILSKRKRVCISTDSSVEPKKVKQTVSPLKHQGLDCEPTYRLSHLADMASNQHDIVRRPQDAPIRSSRIFLMKEHCNNSFSVMNQLRKDEQLLDVRLRINQYVFSAHRVVLASCSPYLKAMFTCGMRESSQEEIELLNIEPQALELLIDFAYTGEIEVTTENVQDLLPAAGILQLKDLKISCCEFLSDHMEVSNCLGIKQFADMHSCPNLVKKANRFIIRKFTDVVKTDEFVDVSHSILSELLENDHLHVENELQVFEAFLRWIDHDLDGRAPYAYDLLDCIRIPLLPKDYWERVFNSHRMFQISRECHAYIRGYLMGLNFTTLLVKPRSPIETIYSIGGRNSHRCLSTAERYVPEEDRWEELPPMKQVSDYTQNLLCLFMVYGTHNIINNHYDCCTVVNNLVFTCNMIL